jgi:hypothetical protein
VEDQSTVLRLLTERHDDLLNERTRLTNRLHALFRDLLPGGAPTRLSADKAAALMVRITDDLTGLNALLELLTAHGDSPDTPIPVAIETSRGLLVACLRATGRPVYAINPMAAARYRERHAVSRKKSDHLDATVLANILRTDRTAFRTCRQTANSPRP